MVSEPARVPGVLIVFTTWWHLIPLSWFLLGLYSRSSERKLLLATEMFDITLLALVNHVTFPTQGDG